ncbi:MAG: large subunit ribosomal protein L7Ae [Patescibacteria group bacterium]|jgi:large subunit ribosomal protein L7Ae
MKALYETVEKASKTGKIDKGINEVTKAVERNVAKAVVYASDVTPKELTQHLPILCKEKDIPCVAVDSRENLGIVAGIKRPTAAIAILEAGEANLKLLK